MVVYTKGGEITAFLHDMVRACGCVCGVVFVGVVGLQLCLNCARCFRRCKGLYLVACVGVGLAWARLGASSCAVRDGVRARCPSVCGADPWRVRGGVRLYSADYIERVGYCCACLLHRWRAGARECKP